MNDQCRKECRYVGAVLFVCVDEWLPSSGVGACVDTGAVELSFRTTRDEVEAEFASPVVGVRSALESRCVASELLLRNAERTIEDAYNDSSFTIMVMYPNLATVACVSILWLSAWAGLSVQVCPIVEREFRSSVRPVSRDHCQRRIDGVQTRIHIIGRIQQRCREDANFKTHAHINTLWPCLCFQSMRLLYQVSSSLNYGHSDGNRSVSEAFHRSEDGFIRGL